MGSSVTQETFGNIDHGKIRGPKSETRNPKDLRWESVISDFGLLVSDFGFRISDFSFMHFTNAQLILPDSIQRGSLAIRHGRIEQISRPGKTPRHALDLRSGYLAPGFID